MSCCEFLNVVKVSLLEYWKVVDIYSMWLFARGGATFVPFTLPVPSSVYICCYARF